MVQPGYNQHLFDASHDLIRDLQSGANNIAWTIWGAYSDTCLYGISFIPAIACFAFVTQRHRSMYLIIAFSLMTTLSSLLKLYFHDPRPFWVWDDIKVTSCSTQFGNPSGHTLTSTGMAMTIWLDFNRYSVA